MSEHTVSEHVAISHPELGSLYLTRNTTVEKLDGDKISFGVRWDVYPVTILQARYNGSYEGAPWLCFPVSPERMTEAFWQGWNDSDVECMHWWAEATRRNHPIGYGASPTSAYENLIRRLAKRGGVEYPAADTRTG